MRDNKDYIITGFTHGFYPHQTGADVRAGAGGPDVEIAVGKRPLTVSRRNLGVKKIAR